MSDTLTSNYMSLPIPIVGTTLGPAWANDVNNCLQIIDNHNHSLGYGNPINSNGISINADFPLNSYNLTLVKTINFSAQTSTIPAIAPNLGCLYVSNNELIYNDKSGNIVPITTSGSVNAGAGSITGLPSGTAAATYSAGNFIWQAATNTAANLDCGSVLIRNSTANSKSLTLTPPNAISSNYSITLPALPLSTSFLVLDTTGNMLTPYSVSLGLTGSMMQAGTITSTQIASGTILGSNIGLGTITGSNIVNNTITATQIANSTITSTQLASNAVITSTITDASVTPAKKSALGQQISATSGNSNIVTNNTDIISVSITTTGRPVRIELISDGANINSSIWLSLGGSVAIARDGTPIAYFSSTATVYWPASSIAHFDVVGAGTYTYSFRSVSITPFPSHLGTFYCKILAYEL